MTSTTSTTSTTRPPDAVAAHGSRRWLALAVLCAAQLMIVLDASIVNIALPHVQAALHISDASRQWALTAYTLAFGGLLLLGGRIADYVGRRRAFLVALLGFALASALGGAAQSAGWLFGARALQGAFAAVLAPAALSLVTTTFTETRERAKAFAVYGAISAAGAAIGLLAGGALTEYASWRWTLLVNAPIALMVAAAALPLIAESRAEGNRRYDVPGAALVTAALVALVYGFSDASTHSWTGATTLSFIAAGVALLAAFAGWELRAANPLLPMRVVLDRNRGGAYLSFFLVPMGLFAMFLFLSYYFQEVRGYTALHAGLAAMPFPVGIVVSAAVASRAMPRFGSRVLAPVGFALAMLGVVWFTRLTPDASYLTSIVPAQLLVSLGMGQVFISLSSTALVGVSNHDAGVASALVNAMQQVGASLGIAFLNTIATTATAHYAAAHHGLSGTALVHGFTTAFAVTVGIFVLALLVVLALVRDRGQAPDDGRRSAPDEGGFPDGLAEPRTAPALTG